MGSRRFNGAAGIYGKVKSCLGQRYPADKLSIIVVDDCSSDDSYSHARRAARESSRVSVLRNDANMGKRRSINRAVRAADTEIIVSVDSDCIVDDDAVAQLVRRFVSPQIAAVGARVNVINKHDNWLTRMQAIKYYLGYEYLKNVERAFRRVMCLSGCLTAYRRDVLIELEPILEHRNWFGIPIKYGEDRFLTRQIVKAGYHTVLTLDAVCHTRAPTELGGYFAQQLRWRRSNLIDYLGGLSHAWRLPPLVGIHYLTLFALLLAYPAFIVESLAHGTFFDAMVLHLGVVAAFGAVYYFHNRTLPAADRVSPLWFLAMAFVMPVTYLVLTPLAAFTLDSGSWETRGHSADIGAVGDDLSTAPASPRSLTARTDP